MQHVAGEFNLSETAFLTPRGPGAWDLRWFTPLVEVELCGHATLASAHVLFDQGHLRMDEEVCFHTLSGVLKATVGPDEVTLNFPSEAPEEAQVDGLEEALDERVVWCGRNRMDCLVQLDSERTVRYARPNLEALAQIDARGLIVTAHSSSEDYDVVSRFFAPACGVPEDPVTGSAHCALAPFWAERLGRGELMAYQASRRGGYVRLTLAGDRVLLGGQVQLVASGTLLG